MNNYITSWIYTGIAGCLLFLLTVPASGQHLAVGIMGGTTGVGGEIVGKLHNNFNLRVGGRTSPTD